MKRRIISCLIIAALLLAMIPNPVYAQEVNQPYNQDQIDAIVQKYDYHENMLNTTFCTDTVVGYWGAVNDIKQNGTLTWALDMSSKLIGEYPEKQDYAEILANLITMQTGELVEQIETQSRFDDLKNIGDYAWDVVEIVAASVGASGALETISAAIDTGVSGIDNVIIKNNEQAKYYEATLRDYSQSNEFLRAISQYAENEELRTVASSLLKANDTLLLNRLEYIVDAGENIAKYQGKFFLENMSMELLKEADLYATDETVKFFVDEGINLKNIWLTAKSAYDLTFKTLILAGDIGFGTSDVYNRYQEMKIVADIAAALVKANEIISVPNKMDQAKLEKIQQKCNIYKSLIITHARGEYLLYQLLINDAGVLSDIRWIIEYFNKSGKTTDAWYNGQIQVLTRYCSIVDEIARYIAFEPLDVKITDLTEAPINEDILSGKCGDNLTWTLKNGVLTISGTGAMPSYDLPSVIPWFDYLHEVTKIVIEDGVTNISDSAFSYHDNVTSVSIGSSVTSIGSGAFYDCGKLTQITIPDGVTSIGINAFYGCRKLKTVTVPQSVDSIESGAFGECGSLVDVYYAGSKAEWNAIRIEDYNEDLLTAKIHYAIEDDDAITGTCGSNLTWKLKDGLLTISGTGKMDNYDYDNSIAAPWYDYLESITSVIVEEGVVSVGEGAFSYCENLAEAKISDSVTSIGKQAFADCNALKKVFIGSGVNKIDKTALKSCDNLERIEVSNENRSYRSQDGVLFDKDKTILDTYPRGKNNSTYNIPDSVTEIAWGAFSNNKQLEKVVIPNSVTKIGDLAFSQCTQLNSLNIPNSVKTIGLMAFAECSRLTNVVIPKSVKSLDELAFSNCWNLKTITFLGDACSIGSNAFMDVKAKAYYPAENKTWITSIRQNYGGKITWIAEGEVSQTGMELAAYRPVVEKAMRNSGYITNNDTTKSFCEGILLDLDSDGVQELVLKHLSNNEPYLGAEYLLSVYDYENGKVVTRMNSVSFGEFGGAGETAYVTILYKSGSPYIMTYNEFGETSGGGSMKPNITGIARIYEGKSCKEIGFYWIDRYQNAMSYEIDGKAVGENVFIKSIEAYDGVEVVCEMYQLIDLSQKLSTASKLLAQMK